MAPADRAVHFIFDATRSPRITLREAARDVRGSPSGIRPRGAPRFGAGAGSTPLAAERRRLLFTGGGGAASEALNRLLGRRCEVYFADADPDAKPASIPVASWHAIPMASSPDFVEEL